MEKSTRYALTLKIGPGPIVSDVLAFPAVNDVLALINYLLEIGDRGTRVGKRYRLSPQGDVEARRILKELLS